MEGVLSPEVRAHLKIRVLDSIGCAIGALRAQPMRAIRELVNEFDGAGLCGEFLVSPKCRQDVQTGWRREGDLNSRDPSAFDGQSRPERLADSSISRRWRGGVPDRCQQRPARTNPRGIAGSMSLTRPKTFGTTIHVQREGTPRTHGDAIVDILSRRGQQVRGALGYHSASSRSCRERQHVRFKPAAGVSEGLPGNHPTRQSKEDKCSAVSWNGPARSLATRPAVCHLRRWKCTKLREPSTTRTAN